MFEETSSDWTPRVFGLNHQCLYPSLLCVQVDTRTECEMASLSPAASVKASMKLFNFLVMNEIGAETRPLFDAYVPSSSGRRDGAEGDTDDAGVDEGINTQPTCTLLLKSPSCGVRRRGGDGEESPSSDGACLLCGKGTAHGAALGNVAMTTVSLALQG